ncbi:mCG18798, isoform CRA_a [Mus musculus]|nr:mCG18798, isoform CRA_a [Mus musculus]
MIVSTHCPFCSPFHSFFHACVLVCVRIHVHACMPGCVSMCVSKICLEQYLPNNNVCFLDVGSGKILFCNILCTFYYYLAFSK